jgi:hypothetical protein
MENMKAYQQCVRVWCPLVFRARQFGMMHVRSKAKATWTYSYLILTRLSQYRTVLYNACIQRPHGACYWYSTVLTSLHSMQ